MFEAIHECLFVSAPVVTSRSFDFQQTQICTAAAQPMVEHEREEHKRKEARRAQEYQVERARKCIEEIHEVL